MATFFFVLIGGALGIVAGFVAGIFVGSAIAAATHMSTFEGAAGYFAVFFCGPIGALIGLIIGVWIALRLRGVKKGIGAILSYSGAVFATLFVASAAVIWLMLTFDTTLNRNSAPRQVLFEIRTPPGTRLAADRGGVEIELNTDRNSATAYKSKEEYQYSDGNRPVISGGVEIAFRTSNRIIVLKRKGEPDRLFQLKLASNPGHTDAFGPWQPIDWVAEPDAQQPRKATAADQYDIRYRVRDPNVEFSRPIIAFELSLPAATPLPDDPKTIRIVALEAANDMDGAINPESIKRENDRLSLGGTVQLAGETHSLIAVSIPGQPTRLFEITLPKYTWITETVRYATTSPQDESNRTFSPWLNVVQIREAAQTQSRAATPEDDAKLRYLLR